MDTPIGWAEPDQVIGTPRMQNSVCAADPLRFTGGLW